MAELMQYVRDLRVRLGAQHSTDNAARRGTGNDARQKTCFKQRFHHADVSDVIQGWKLTIPPLSSAEWASHATIWCHVLCGRATVPCLERELQLKMTFLHAVRAGLGEFNMLHSPVLIKRMRRKAHRVGLASPTSIIMDSVALATAAVLAYEREQEVRYEKASEAMRMLPAGVGDRRILLESDVESPCGGASGVGLGSEDEDEDEIVYDDDTVGL
ncbi:hypothetical protein B0A55_01553 [Friedmanniomyces simplex]|uniref:Uncharacterized protein n=1 Tax=Friedmanniomyces simplex TaxID=329884 RepID=A0A4U0XY80_9PEZI|nr:hypothetical protein B0A55_01553 [Friedmanniomyces simplex]